MLQTPSANGDGLLTRLIESAGAAIFGALVTLVTFRTRLALVDRELADLKLELAKQRSDTDRRHEENKKTMAAEHEAIRNLVRQHMQESAGRQRMVLEIVAGIARKVGADGRFSDALVRYLNEEDKG